MKVRALTIGGTWLCLALLALSAPACDDFSAYCEEVVDCQDGNELDMEACEVGVHEEAERASLYGCKSYFDTLADCVEQESKCSNDVYGLEGNDCNDESREYSSCMAD